MQMVLQGVQAQVISGGHCRVTSSLDDPFELVQQIGIYTTERRHGQSDSESIASGELIKPVS